MMRCVEERMEGGCVDVACRDDADKDVCAICLDEIECSHGIQLRCGHEFHAECLLVSYKGGSWIWMVDMDAEEARVDWLVVCRGAHAIVEVSAVSLSDNRM